MGLSWDNPKWRQQGRTGPNGPRYAKARDRRAVQGGGTPGGKGGCAVVVVGAVGAVVALAGAVVEKVFNG